MNALYALFADPAAAQLAVDTLHAAGSELGFHDRQIVVLSGEPHEGYPFSDQHATTRPYRWSVLGGAVGGICGYLLTTLSQKSYPIVTGGMSLTPTWTNGIIIYESIMLGAIVTTLIVLLVGAGLPSFKSGITDPAIGTGKILVGVMDPPQACQAELERRLRQAGASEVKRSIT